MVGSNGVGLATPVCRSGRTVAITEMTAAQSGRSGVVKAPAVRKIDRAEPNTRLLAVRAGMVVACAGVAERLGSGLQSRIHGFESRHSLRKSVLQWTLSLLRRIDRARPPPIQRPAA